MQKEMFRYGVGENGRKDTLFTFREGELIFFGIARCNLKVGDKFDREKGRLIAQKRALKAQELVASGEEVPTDDTNNLDSINAFVHYGCIPLGQIKSLLNYFHSLRTTYRA
jgi:hypothetical protein